MTDTPVTTIRDPAAAGKAQRPKMTLDAQACFLSELLDRCKMSAASERPGEFAGAALLSLTTEEMLKLETVWQTMRFMDMHRADQMVRDKIARGFRNR